MMKFGWIALQVLVEVIPFSAASDSLPWVDKDSPADVFTTRSYSDGSTLSLVYSDEFNVPGRSFVDGSDPRWTAVNKNDYTNEAMHYYNSDLVTTNGGHLNITTTSEPIDFNVGYKGKAQATKHFQTGMVQGWNKFCFTGGIMETSAKLPGNAATAGLWPAIWMLGNLARATYVDSSQNVWPWSFDTCSRDQQLGQQLSACNKATHFGLNALQGRGSPEIDILEAMAGELLLENTPISRPYFSASLQVSPALSEIHPSNNAAPEPGAWYDKGLEYGNDTALNIFFYGSTLDYKMGKSKYTTDALSANRNLNRTDFNAFHKYRLEWETGENGYLRWYFDDALVYGIRAEALQATGAIIPEEPMYLIFNTAISHTWGFPYCDPTACDCYCFDCSKLECLCSLPYGFCDMLPTSFLVDYVRVYQRTKPSDTTDPSTYNPYPQHTVGCSPESHPTELYIKGNADRFKLPDDEAPLKDIMVGGGACRVDTDCGPHNENSTATSSEFSSRCRKRKCECGSGLVGPLCKAYAVVLDKEGDGATSIFAVDAQGSHVTIPSGMPLVAALLLCGAIYVVFERHRVILQVQYAPMLERHIRRVPDASDGEETSYGSI